MTSTKRATSGRKRDAIHFVNARPTSENERLKIQRLVRAHVGKWISDQTKDRSTVPDCPNPSAGCHPNTGANTTTTTTSRSVTRQSISSSEGSAIYFDQTGSSESQYATPPATSPLCSSVSSSPSPPPHLPGQYAHDSSPVTQFTSSNPVNQQLLRSSSRSPVGHIMNDVERSYPDKFPWPSPQESRSGMSDTRKSSSGSDEASQALTTTSPFSCLAPGYVDTFGAGRFDPFQTHPLNLLNMGKNEVVASEYYCLEVLWPGLTPVSPGNDSSPASTNWFPLSLSDPTLFTAFVFGSLSHKRVQWLKGTIPHHAFLPSEQQMLQLCEAETIRNVTREVSDPTRAMCDAVILSVICMAHNVANNEHIKGQKLPFTAPMQRLQWLDIYSSLPPNLVHIRGLIQMVNMRGGLENLTLPGLAPTLCFSDLVTCSTFLLPPVFDFMPLRRERIGLTMQDLLGYSMADVERRFGPLREIGFTSEMLEVFYGMQAYIELVEAHVTTQHHNPDYSLLSDQRNRVHYNLLSLPAVSQFDRFANYQPHEVMYEICRLAGLIFGVGVVLPLQAQSAPLSQLAKLIQEALHISKAPFSWDHPQARIALFWVLILGGIAAEDQPERAWYVELISQVAGSHGIHTWDEARKVLRVMLWYDRACERGGRKLWLEVRQSGPSTS
ncbi:uncharacterized protein BO95DRAFT_284167 [Aspergillus brunneoviolaceus CBS 621.78]|uniref:Uncharacterized protein n=1 Tax=Aspergillus brunneoviolaceus CBS 621.78 TaxID=1450534 RepID=A0ACD1GJG0_9EURO|nr:hypothetical protein BO95DRAFT_284167 [Aspergillus brunneoviolaceus CBS 621.78]RAH49419.1 hypothetical protein BO95DRAFT_284167 [Aspergillus brunneoviolaceus CBS 621.78]